MSDALVLDKVSKAFGHTQALDGLDLRVAGLVGCSRRDIG
jgi:ABC-type uncharacterized transport system ATPase subunit